MAFDSKVPPIVTARLNDTSHLLWRVDDADAVRGIEEDLAEARLLILDGHHRFTAAANIHSVYLLGGSGAAE